MHLKLIVCALQLESPQRILELDLIHFFKISFSFSFSFAFVYVYQIFILVRKNELITLRQTQLVFFYSFKKICIRKTFF